VEVEFPLVEEVELLEVLEAYSLVEVAYPYLEEVEQVVQLV
jgi:hypothetical protein